MADGVAGCGGGCRHVRPLSLDCRLRGEEGLRCQDHQRPGHRQAASRFGIKTDDQVLSENEKNGHEKTPATEAAQAAVDEVWGWLTKYNLTDGMVKPAGRLLP